MAKFNWNEVTVDDVIRAIPKFDSEHPEHPEPRSTFLVYGGKKYPAKHIRGMAYQVHFGKEISKEDYSGGKETVRFFDKLGFETQYIHQSIERHSVKKTVIKAKKEQMEPMPLKEEVQSISPKKILVSAPLTERDKIAIPTKGVTEQKNALQLILNKLCEGDIVCEKTYPWMKTPSEISGEYQPLYDSISAYRGNKEFAKKNVALRCDFVCESRKLIIEYDERQHFSEARRVSLLSYSEIQLNYDRELWIRACSDIQAKDNQPADRDEIRAFYDSVRDIEAAKHGYILVRIMHGQVDFELPDATEKLKDMLGITEETNQQGKTLQFTENDSRKPLKIGLYLQTDEVCNKVEFCKAMNIVRDSDIDILVLPEIAYVPFVEQLHNADYLNDAEVQALYDRALELSRDIGKAVVFCNEDKYGTIMSIFANAFASEGETVCKDYIKHTMTDFSACEIENYSQYAEGAFQPILI